MRRDAATAAFRFRAVAAALALSVAAHSAFAQAPATPGSATPQSSPAAQDIRDIRGPKPIRSAWFIPLIVVTGLLSGAAVYATWAWYRRRCQPIPQTAAEIALGRLELARALMRPGLDRDFSIEVSGIARGYIESRFQVKAAHLTTHEFLHESLASRDPVLAANRALLADFLASCDLAKFGGWSLSIDVMEGMWESARRLIVQSALEPNLSDAAKAAAATPARTADPRPLAPPREPYDSIPST
jgi:hypothetical protein